MKKRLIFCFAISIILLTFLTSALCAHDTANNIIKESDSLFWENFQKFLTELIDGLEIHPDDPEDNIGGKYDETEVDRRGHRIRIPPSERNNKKTIEIGN